VQSKSIRSMVVSRLSFNAIDNVHNLF
jgi:hypothetical protein